MTKRRYLIPGGKFKTHQEALYFRRNSGTVHNVEKMGGQIQIRRKADGFHVVVRREEGKE